ncbi:hypothetical protein [Paractinoplanes globisporus]|uniref:Uncharacterized protein n=1 Tax=Paractinoplanes globisporus TaxID=113565 RepID=A0ABW6WLY6_9ACTN|nr:hypothetical protein [Actinoplanes globisporus]
MNIDNTDRRRWQLRNLTVIETLIRDHDLPVMIWTVTPFGIAGEPYSATDDAGRRAAFEGWADVLGAARWAPQVEVRITTLRAAVKDYQGASIMLRAVLFEGDSAAQ